MTKVWFSPEELDAFTVKQLKVLAEYFHVDASGKKKDIIAAISNVWEGDDVNDENRPAMSVQVARIYDQLRKEANL